MVSMSPSYKSDYEHYKDYVRSRELLFDTEIKDRLEYSYQLLYILSTISSSVNTIDPRSKIKHFYNEVKNNFIITFDLINMNYLNSAKQVLRSTIEAFFRFSLTLHRYIEYKENRKRQIFHATDTLKDLKAMSDTHSVWKMTSYTVNYFEDTPIKTIISNLNHQYSILSGNVHVNSNDNFTLQEYLSEYAVYDFTKSSDTINLYNQIITEMLVAIYYFTFLLIDENVFFDKKDIQVLELNSISGIKLTLDNIDEYFTSISDS
ncbi:hypothetical protein IHV12_21925 [Fictibacillus sp. 7GRE50]|uniref:hypothetical protein n=1 Tax=Fictibacillus sp. 7GRE50 TaxID=2745878 RepID=UPI0018CD32CB|nr:hypothetical protein [Fictibacillus sp. 7GRE50]MBH0167570.1 hypothetical protein [Fictibacillus sp. 7GRE50]